MLGSTCLTTAWNRIAGGALCGAGTSSTSPSTSACRPPHPAISLRNPTPTPLPPRRAGAAARLHVLRRGRPVERDEFDVGRRPAGPPAVTGERLTGIIRSIARAQNHQSLNAGVSQRLRAAGGPGSGPGRGAHRLIHSSKPSSSYSTCPAPPRPALSPARSPTVLLTPITIGQ